ncbi:MAG: gliding motility lipoprotein GldH [Paludibacter sp.]|nr:gliding motility lipoprotein GldH [Paludibacter sp.]
MPKKRLNKSFWVLFVAIFAIACTSNDVYFQYQSVAQKGWSKDSLYRFDIPITDTVATYNVYVNVRNRGEYPYQNLWLFLNKTTPDSIQSKDSIECYLADQRGKWLGKGLGSILEMPVLYQQNVRFKKAGTYHYKIVQGMRDSVLKGINDIGMRVEKVGRK